jgi:hypothetical protein
MDGVGNDYTFALGPYNSSSGQYYILWDNEGHKRKSFRGPKGHWFNTSHPQLNGNWKNPTCIFGVYDKDLVLDIRTCPENVRLYVLSNCEIVGDGKRELLIDYHWHITEYFGLFCGDYDCHLCFKSLKLFMEKWESRIEQNST